MLDEIFDRQLKLQTRSFGVDPFNLDPEAKVQFIKDMTLALEDELHEALGEVGWKPWATSRHINDKAFGGELVDALHFLVNLFLAIGWSADEVLQAYLLKASKNEARQRRGYDGVSGKCPRCHRALDDDGVKCTAAICAEGIELVTT
jgi:dimeric dUTPase (all-alpha-NTP-PPase superfamily)